MSILSDVTRQQAEQAFDEWLRRYTEHPEEFEQEWETVTEFLAETSEGKRPSYGQECVAYLCALLEEMTSSKAPPASSADLDWQDQHGRRNDAD